MAIDVSTLGCVYNNFSAGATNATTLAALIAAGGDYIISGILYCSTHTWNEGSNTTRLLGSGRVSLSGGVLTVVRVNSVTGISIEGSVKILNANLSGCSWENFYYRAAGNTWLFSEGLILLGSSLMLLSRMLMSQ